MRILSFLLLLVTGLGMAVPGLWLAGLGGSPYYVVSGTLIVISAVLVLRGRSLGIWLFLLVFAGSVAWALWEVGLDGWALMPRLVYLAVAALWLLLFNRPRRSVAVAGLLLLALGGASAVGALLDRPAIADTPRAATPASTQVNGSWEYYGGSLHATRYSQLAEITPANAGRLEQAWTYHAGMFGKDAHSAHLYEGTLLMVDGLLYGCTPHSAAFALDPVTGKQVWRRDIKIDLSYGGRGLCRGVTFFRTPVGGNTPAECPTRLLLGTVDNRLIALDAKTGASCKSFGTDGAVDLSEGEGLKSFPRGWINPTSPPTIVHGTAVIGSYIIDDQSTFVPPGVIRGYDPVTGKLKWAFDPGRPDDHAPPAPGKSYTPSTPNSWPPFSGDEALGLVYLPMGMGSPDFIGTYRTPQTERFASAVVALDADTGTVRWVFQAIHHDLWDYDIGSQPVLADFPTAQGPVPALIQPTKTGQVFVLDRRTGRPLTKVQERLVPASLMPGDHAAPTQPFSVGMPDFAGPTLTEKDMWGITPFDQLYCRIQFHRALYQGIYTPPHPGRNIRTPGELGGIDWGSVAVDEGRSILVVNSNVMADYDHFIPRAQADREGLYIKGDPRARHTSPGAAMAGTPWAVHWTAFLSPLDIPCQRPPYGYLTAVDLKTRKVLWQHSLGTAANSGPFGHALGLPFQLGAPNIGGSLVTKGGVIFIGATQDKYFRAVDEASGKVLWQVALPAGGQATPMTYRGADGHQYVVIAAGGSTDFGTGSGDSFIAYRLRP